jgi:predicted nucleic acid-binding protein
MSVDETAAEVIGLQSIFQTFRTTQRSSRSGKRLVSKNEVKGKEVYDARIVAVMLAHRVTRLLTFNTADFKRYTGDHCINPREV